MPRSHRNWIDHACYHVTHRCHERAPLFRFAVHRRLYLDELREMNRRYGIDVLNYAVTHNHIHLLVWARAGEEIARAIQYAHSRVAQRYNRLKSREGAFWSGRYHATLIQSGRHLSRCVFYIDLNMVRPGAVRNPADWQFSGCRELLGLRQRYRIINRSRLLSCLAIPEDGIFRAWYERTLADKVAHGYHVREPYWTEALAVGEKAWIESIADRITSRKKVILPAPGDGDGPLRVGEPQTFYLALATDA